MSLNLKTVDLNLLVIFEAVYSTGNISHASERLNMTQSAVSNALTRLRHHLDDPLFIRKARGVTPTSKAHEIIAPIRSALGLIERQFGNSEIDLATYERLFRIALIDSVEPFLMPPILRLITEKAPGISIECLQALPNSADDIRSGKLDLVCLPYPLDSTELVIEPANSVDLVVVSRRGHPGISGPLDLKTFASLGHIALNRTIRGASPVQRDLAANHVKTRIVYMVNKVWSIPAMVERTDLISLLPREFALEVQRNFAIDIHESPLLISDQHLFVMWHVGNQDNPGHRWFREALMAGLRPAEAEVPLGAVNGSESPDWAVE